MIDIIKFYKKNFLVRFLFIVVCNLLFVPLILFGIFIKLFFNIVFVRIRDDRIGHLAANTMLFLTRLERKKMNKRLYIGIVSNRPVNKQLLKMFQRRLKIIQINKSIFSNYFFRTLSNKNSLLNILNIYSNLPLDSNEFDDFNKLKPLFFSEEEEEKGRTLCKKMGVDNWFICFHNRDELYLNKYFKKDDLHSVRNDSVIDYLKSANFIASLGGYSLRMGSFVKKSLTLNSDHHIIDYANNYRSDFGDIFLAAKCKFFLGNTSGILFVASIFRRPVASVNIIPYKYFRIMKSDLFIPKKIFDIKKNSFLSFKEIIERKIINYSSLEQYGNEGLRVINNSPDEILDLTIEMNSRIDGTWKETKKDINLQKKFKLLFDGVHCGGFPSKIGAKFLRENEKLLK